MFSEVKYFAMLSIDSGAMLMSIWRWSKQEEDVSVSRRGMTYGNVHAEFFGPEVESVFVCRTADIEQFAHLFVVLNADAPQLMLRVRFVGIDICMTSRGEKQRDEGQNQHCHI